MIQPAKSGRDGGRRLNPRLWDPDWILLKELRRTIEQGAVRIAGPGLRVVDYGCGASPYRELFVRRGATYIGADFHGADLTLGAGGEIPLPDQAADVVVSFQVLEHVPAPQQYLAEVRRVLKKNGRLLLSTHGTWLYHPHPGDFYRWTRQGLEVELARADFVVEYCESLVGPLAWTTMLRAVGLEFILRKWPAVRCILGIPVLVFMNLQALVEERLTPTWVRRDNACTYFVMCRRSDCPSSVT